MIDDDIFSCSLQSSKGLFGGSPSCYAVQREQRATRGTWRGGDIAAVERREKEKSRDKIRWTWSAQALSFFKGAGEEFTTCLF